MVCLPLGVLDGWWCEGCIEGVTGWAIGDEGQGIDEKDNRSQDAASLYKKLEENVIPLFYQNRPQFIDVMRHTIALNGSFFNTQRNAPAIRGESVFRINLSRNTG